MRKFKVVIADRLALFFSEEDATKSKKIVEELKKLESGHSAVVAKSEKAKEEIYWPAHEALRKGHVLSYSTDRLSELQANLYGAQAAVRGPLEDESKKWDELSSEHEALTSPLREEIVGYIEKYLEEAIGAKRAHYLGADSRFIDRGEWGQDIKVITIEQNFAAAEKVIELLQEFKQVMRGFTPKLCVNNRPIHLFSCDQIIDEVRKFEKQVGAIDIYEVQKEEVRKDRWQDLRQAKLLI